jgi:hypothetical protein
VYWVFRGIEFDQVLTLFKGVSVPLILLAFILMFASYSLGTAQWRTFLNAQRLHVPWRRCFTYYYTGQFFSNFLFSNIGGDVVRLIDVARGESVCTGRVFASILVDRVFGLVCLIMIGLLALPGYIVHERISAFDFVAHLYGLFAVLILSFWFFVFSKRMRYFSMRLAQYLPFARLRRGIFHLFRVFSCYRRKPGVFLRALAWGIANQTLKMGVAFLVLVSLSGSFASVPPYAFIVFIPILGMVKALPISIMGIGPHELAGQWLFAKVGVAGDFALSFLLLYQIVAIASNVASGIFVFARRDK